MSHNVGQISLPTDLNICRNERDTVQYRGANVSEGPAASVFRTAASSTHHLPNCYLQHHVFLGDSLPTNSILLISQKAILLKGFLFLFYNCIAIQRVVYAIASVGQMQTVFKSSQHNKFKHPALDCRPFDTDVHLVEASQSSRTTTRNSEWSQRGMASVNQTRPHCVNQMGKTHSKPLAARHGRGTLCESALKRRGASPPSNYCDLPFSLLHRTNHINDLHHACYLPCSRLSVEAHSRYCPLAFGPQVYNSQRCM
jgi:hypothetical protein